MRVYSLIFSTSGSEWESEKENVPSMAHRGEFPNRILEVGFDARHQCARLTPVPPGKPKGQKVSPEERLKGRREVEGSSLKFLASA